MTRIEFNFNVPDKRQLIENLALAALQKHRKVTIFTENAAQSASISEYLWQNNPTSFLPNIVTDLVADSARAIPHASASRIVIGSQADAFDNDLNHDDLLINLTATEPRFFSRCCISVPRSKNMAGPLHKSRFVGLIPPVLPTPVELCEYL